MLEERQRREEHIAEERQRREEQAALERAQMREMEMLKRLVERTMNQEQEWERVPVAAVERTKDSVKLMKFTETDDIEAYLTTFKRMMSAYEVEKTRWAYKLAPQLTSSAQQARPGECRPGESRDLRRSQGGDPSVVRHKRGDLPSAGSDHGEKDGRELATRLHDLATKWIRECTTMEELQQLMTAEQVLDVLPRDIQVWVRERKPRTSEEAGQLAEDYLQARKANIDRPPMQPREHDGAGSIHSSRELQEQGLAVFTVFTHSRFESKCFNCGRKGHLSRQCMVMHCLLLSNQTVSWSSDKERT